MVRVGGLLKRPWSRTPSSRGRVGLGDCSPRPPTEPYVRTLPHTVHLMMVSPCNQLLHARVAIPSRYGDTWFQVRSLGRVSRPGVQHQAPPFGFSFPPPGPVRTSSPASSVLRRCYDFLPLIPPRFVAFAWWYLGCTCYVRSSADECTAEAWS